MTQLASRHLNVKLALLEKVLRASFFFEREKVHDSIINLEFLLNEKIKSYIDSDYPSFPFLSEFVSEERREERESNLLIRKGDHLSDCFLRHSVDFVESRMNEENHSLNLAQTHRFDDRTCEKRISAWSSTTINSCLLRFSFTPGGSSFHGFLTPVFVLSRHAAPLN